MTSVKARIYYDNEKLLGINHFSEKLDTEDIHFKLDRVEIELSAKFDIDDIQVQSNYSEDSMSLIITIGSSLPKDKLISSLETTVSDLGLFGKLLDE